MQSSGRNAALRRSAISALCAAGMVSSALAEAPAMGGTWRGSYDCAQGRTGLTLTIDQQDGAAFTGVFHFYAIAENPSVPEGCFTISGQVSDGGRVDVTGGTWLKRPAGYVLVDLKGQLTSDGSRLPGVVTTPGQGKLCTSFRLSKISRKPDIASPCQRAPSVS